MFYNYTVEPQTPNDELLNTCDAQCVISIKIEKNLNFGRFLHLRIFQITKNMK